MKPTKISENEWREYQAVQRRALLGMAKALEDLRRSILQLVRWIEKDKEERNA